MTPDNESIIRIVRTYLAQREDMQRRTQGSPLFKAQGVGAPAMSHFSEMINTNAGALFMYLPAMNLEEMQAFSELVNSRLSQVRWIHDKEKSR